MVTRQALKDGIYCQVLNWSALKSGVTQSPENSVFKPNSITLIGNKQMAQFNYPIMASGCAKIEQTC